MAEPTPSFYIPSRLFYSLQHLDFGQLLSLMLTVGATITSAFFVIRNTAYRICGYYTSTVEVRSDDQNLRLLDVLDKRTEAIHLQHIVCC